MVPIFTFSSHTEYVKRESIVLYTNRMLLLATRTTQTQSFTFYKEFFFGRFHSK